MATQKHVWAYLGIVVLVTWLANGIIPELQAGNIPIPATWAWLVRSLVPALVAITVLLPSVVAKPPGVPDVPTTVSVPTVSVRPSPTMTITSTTTNTPTAPALVPSEPPPAIPDPTPKAP